MDRYDIQSIVEDSIKDHVNKAVEEQLHNTEFVIHCTECDEPLEITDEEPDLSGEFFPLFRLRTRPCPICSAPKTAKRDIIKYVLKTGYSSENSRWKPVEHCENWKIVQRINDHGLYTVDGKRYELVIFEAAHLCIGLVEYEPKEN